EVLLAGLVADDTLQVAYQLRVRVGADYRADDVVSRPHVRDPVANRLRSRVLERLRPGGHLFDLGSEQLHAPDVHRLPAHVLGAHVDGALEAEPRRHCGHGHAVLSRAGLCNHALLFHPQREQGLALVPDLLELLERAHQRLGHVLAAEGTKPSAHGVAHEDCSASRTAWMKARIFSGSLTRTLDSTPLETSTPYGR